MATKTKKVVAEKIKTASTNGQALDSGWRPTTDRDLEREFAFDITPSSLEQIPNGAILSGPRLDGSMSFRGTLKQAGVPTKTLVEWYRLMDLGRMLDDQAANYLKKAMGWSYHAPCAGHEGIQLAMG